MTLPSLGEVVNLRVNAPAPPWQGMETIEQTVARMLAAANQPISQTHVVSAVVVGFGRDDDADDLDLEVEGSPRFGVRPAENSGPGWFV